MQLRKMSDKYHFDATFYLIVLAIAAVIGGTYWQGKRTYERSRGAEVRALLDRENATSVEAFRKQAKNWVANRTDGLKLTDNERKKAEDIIAHAFHDRVLLWTQGQINSKPKSEIDKSQKVHWDAAVNEFNTYITSLGKTPVQ